MDALDALLGRTFVLMNTECWTIRHSRLDLRQALEDAPVVHAVPRKVDPRAVGRREREDVNVTRAVDNIKAAVAEKIERAWEGSEGRSIGDGEIARAVGGQEIARERQGGVLGVAVVEERAASVADEESAFLERVWVSGMVEVDVRETNVIYVVRR